MLKRQLSFTIAQARGKDTQLNRERSKNMQLEKELVTTRDDCERTVESLQWESDALRHV